MSLEKILEEKSVTMYALAKATGLSQSTVHDIVTGKRKDIQLETAVKISQALDIDLQDVYMGVRGIDYESQM